MCGVLRVTKLWYCLEELPWVFLGFPEFSAIEGVGVRVTTGLWSPL